MTSAVDRRPTTDRDFGSSVVARFEQAASGSPAAMALTCAGRTLSYGDLEAAGNRLAHRLRSRGVVPGSIVGLLTHRSIDMVVAWLAILKCGAAYLPLDPANPPRALADMIEDARPALLLAERALAARMADIGDVPQATLEDEIGLGADGNTKPVGPAPGPDDPAYVMFTSGSTGRPKGVVVPHRAILRLVVGADFVTLGPQTVMLALAPPAFDASTLEIWGPLLNGGRVAVFADAMPSLDAIGHALECEGVNTLWLTAGLFHLMVETHLDRLAGLTQLLAGGDVLSPTHVQKALDGLPRCRIVNGYGPTENTTFTCCYDVPRDGWGGGSLPIGLPIAGTSVHIVDEALRPVADGEEGELCAGGQGVALGYINRADLTAERFVPDPFSDIPGAKLYRTGDVVRRRPDGAIEFCGRRDRQVKIDGKRIELDEIELALRDQAALRDAIVVLDAKRPPAKTIVAFVKPHASDHTTVVADLRAALAGRLPAFMIPHRFVVRHEFPLNANGKVDRNALLSSLDVERAPAVPVSLPRQGPEQGPEAIVTGVWQQLLGTDAVDRGANLFDMGATSLTIVKAHARIEAALGRTFPITDMFAHPTIAGLVQRLGVARPNDDTGREGLMAAQARAAQQQKMLQGMRRRTTG